MTPETSPKYVAVILTALMLQWVGPVSGQNQHSFGLRASGDGAYENVVISWPVMLRVKPPGGAIRWSETEISGNEIHVLSDYRCRLMIRPEAPSLPEGMLFTFELATEGHFSPVRNSTSFQFDPSSESTPSLQVEFASEGQGSVLLTLVAASRNGTSFDIDPSRKTARIFFRISTFNDAVKRITGMTPVPNPTYLKTVGRFHDTWDRVYGYGIWDNPEVIAIGLVMARKKLDEMFASMLDASKQGNPQDRLQAAGKLYQLFHDIPGSHTDIAIYRTQSQAAMQNADDNLWSATKADNLESLDTYLRLMAEISDYPSAHGADARNMVAGIIDREFKVAQSDGSRQAYCNWYNLVKGTSYVGNHPDDPRLTTAIKKCQISPCEAAWNRKDYATVLAECEPGSDYYRRANEILNRAKTRDMAQEKYDELEEVFGEEQRRIPVIELLIAELREGFFPFLSDDQRARVDTIDQMIQPCEIGFVNTAPTKMDEQSFYFDLIVFSGVHIQPESFDGSPLPTTAADTTSRGIRYAWPGVPMNLMWVVPDSLMRVTITDGSTHQVLFRAASGDSILIPLDQAEFKASAEALENLLMVRLENGSDPFWLEWHAVSGDQIIFQALDSRTSEIDLSMLPETYNGTYELRVRDRFGRAVTLSKPVTIEQPFQIKLWHWLLIPLVLLLAFLVYRNLFKPEHPAPL